MVVGSGEREGVMVVMLGWKGRGGGGSEVM